MTSIDFSDKLYENKLTNDKFSKIKTELDIINAKILGIHSNSHSSDLQIISLINNLQTSVNSLSSQISTVQSIVIGLSSLSQVRNLQTSVNILAGGTNLSIVQSNILGAITTSKNTIIGDDSTVSLTSINDRII